VFEFCRAPGFLGTEASLCADINLLLQIALALTLLVGAYFAVRQDFDTHQKVQSTVVVVNLFLIAFIMATSYTREVVPGLPDNLARLRAQVSTVHAVLGALAWLTGLYLVLRMARRTRRFIPERLRVKKLKPVMRGVLALWWAVALLGIGTYFAWYGPRGAAQANGGQPTPIALAAGQAVVPIQNFDYSPRELVIPAGTQVTFTNFDEAPHSVTFDDNSADSGLLDEGDQFVRTFEEPGVYPYYCAFHGAAGGTGMAGSVRVVTADQIAALPTAVVPPTATAQATPALPARRPLGEPLAIAAFQDVLAAADSLYIQSVGNEPLGEPPAGTVYQIWLLGPGLPGGRLRLGPLQVAADGSARFNYTSEAAPAERPNLIGLANALEVTIEPGDDPQPDEPSGLVAYAARLPDRALSEIRALVVGYDGAPGGQGLAIGLRRAAEELMRQGQFQEDELAAGNLAELQRRAELMLNLIEGREAPEYGDRNGDGKVQEPGDGYGVLENGLQPGYGASTRDHAVLAGRAGDATDAVRVHSRHAEVCAVQVLDWATQLRDVERRLLAAGDLQAAGPLVQQAGGLARRVLQGFDANGDGAIEPVAGECGARALYEHAQYSAAFGLVPAGELPGGPEPTPGATPEATAAPEPGTVRVIMENFDYRPRTITVTAGTMITWVNFDTDAHSATADDGSWDTGLFGYDLEVGVTFSEPGTYPYYCLLHGEPGGGGMSGTVVVTAP
jgi:plastocyanin/uncharacterized membrane protein YozB (DUF420 family)